MSWLQPPATIKRDVPQPQKVPQADAGSPTPVVIPLLVTDDLEAMAHSRSLEDLQKLAVAVSLMVHGANAGGGLDTTMDKVQSVLGKDYNSVFTVARASDNAVRVRFGAQLTAKSEYAMIPQTHNVTLLVLVPHVASRMQSQPLHIVADTQFVDAISGKMIQPLTNRQFDDRRNQISVIWQRNYHLLGVAAHTDITDADSRLLLSYVQRNDFASFHTFIAQNFNNDPDRAVHFAEALWIDLVSLQNESRYAFSDITIPPTATAPSTVPSGAILVDNGKDATTTVLQGMNFDKFQMDATLHISQTQPAALSYDVPASSVTSDVSGTRLLLTFPPLSAVFKDKSKYDLKGSTLTIKLAQITKAGTIASENPLPDVSALYVEMPADTTAKKSDLTLTTPTQILVGDQNHSDTINLFFKRPNGSNDQLKIKLFAKTLGILTLLDPNSKPIAPDPETGLYTLPVKGTYSLTIPNVAPGGTLTITGNDTSANKLPIDEIDLPMQ